MFILLLAVKVGVLALLQHYLLLPLGRRLYACLFAYKIASRQLSAAVTCLPNYFPLGQA